MLLQRELKKNRKLLIKLPLTKLEESNSLWKKPNVISMPQHKQLEMLKMLKGVQLRPKDFVLWLYKDKLKKK